MAQEVFGDPNQIVLENYYFDQEGEQRYQIIGMTFTILLSVRPVSFSAWLRHSLHGTPIGMWSCNKAAGVPPAGRDRNCVEG